MRYVMKEDKRDLKDIGVSWNPKTGAFKTEKSKYIVVDTKDLEANGRTTPLYSGESKEKALSRLEQLNSNIDLIESLESSGTDVNALTRKIDAQREAIAAAKTQ